MASDDLRVAENGLGQFVRCSYCDRAEENRKKTGEMHGKGRVGVRKVFGIGVVIDVASAARWITDKSRGVVSPEVLFKIGRINRRDQERGERIVERRLPTLVTRNPAARLEQLHRQRVMIGDEFGIAEVIVFVRSLKERDDDRVEKREREKGDEQNSQPGRLEAIRFVSSDRIQ